MHDFRVLRDQVELLRGAMQRRGKLEAALAQSRWRELRTGAPLWRTALGVPVFASDDYVHALYRGAAVAPIEALPPAIPEVSELAHADTAMWRPSTSAR